MKKIGFVIVLTVLSHFIAFGQNQDNFEFIINGCGDNQTITILRYTGTARNICIPDRINGIPVTVIGDYAFQMRNGENRPRIIGNSIIITNSPISQIFEIGLFSVVIPNTVKVIGEGAFANNLLKSIEIPDSVIEIKSGAFSWNQLTHVEIPNSIKEIQPNVFRNNPLISVTIPDSVIWIHSSAFHSHIDWIRSSAFFGNRDNVIIPEKIIIGKSAKIWTSYAGEIKYESISQDIMNGFADYYYQNDKKRGCYTFSNAMWNYSEL